MTVLKRFRDEDGRLIELGWNGTSVEVTTTNDNGDIVNYMATPDVLIDILEDADPGFVAKEIMRKPEEAKQ